MTTWLKKQEEKHETVKIVFSTPNEEKRREEKEIIPLHTHPWVSNVWIELLELPLVLAWKLISHRDVFIVEILPKVWSWISNRPSYLCDKWLKGQFEWRRNCGSWVHRPGPWSASGSASGLRPSQTSWRRSGTHAKQFTSRQRRSSQGPSFRTRSQWPTCFKVLPLAFPHLPLMPPCNEFTKWLHKLISLEP